jgi:acetyl-CoA carboxylase biotin carboxylase subunit
VFKKILIANRGEIALRIIRAGKELGLRTVAAYSEADRETLAVRFADEAVCIGKPAAAESYLAMSRLISAAEVTGCDAVHPGYGFLAENAEFAEACQGSSLVFIGPPTEAIRKMGDKAEAKRLMRQAGVPVVEGSEGILESPVEANGKAREIGYPVMIKAAAGGGGKGMRIVREEEGLEGGFRTAQAEAQAAFGNGGLYLEKYIERPRHIEIQILGDKEGHFVYLGERECSIQRRHQKLIEEAPSPALTPAMRKKMGEAAVKGARAAGYVNAGTIEFLLDTKGHFYFMEMNTRIQVEHPVTEMVTGLDLVKAQIRIAAGEPLPWKQEEIVLKGHALECRINAEDPENGFIPQPGRITSLHFAGGPGVRVDAHIYQDYTVPPYYDSLLAKLVTHGKDRAEAVARMRRVLDECIIEGIKTTIPFHQKVMRDPRFLSGDVDTGYVEALLNGGQR